MSLLVSDLLEVARGEQHGVEPRTSASTWSRRRHSTARRNRPGVTFTTELEETFVRGVPATIERAVGNLLDNAAKWSAAGGEVSSR